MRRGPLCFVLDVLEAQPRRRCRRPRMRTLLRLVRVKGVRARVGVRVRGRVGVRGGVRGGLGLAVLRLKDRGHVVRHGRRGAWLGLGLGLVRVRVRVRARVRATARVTARVRVRVGVRVRVKLPRGHPRAELLPPY